MAIQTINNGETGSAVRGKLNAMFSELYSSMNLPVKISNVSSNTTQALGANTFLQDISVSAVSGSPTVRIGTTPNGTDILPDTAPGSFSLVNVQEYFASATTLYITISGGTANFRMMVLNNYY